MTLLDDPAVLSLSETIRTAAETRHTKLLDDTLNRLTRHIRESDERRLAARVRAQVALGVCSYCSTVSTVVAPRTGEGLCAGHGAGYAYEGKTIVPIEAYRPEWTS